MGFLPEITFTHILGFVVILILFYKYLMRDNDFFERKGLKFVKTKPFIGLYKFLFEDRLSFIDQFTKYYNDFPTEKMFGVFQFFTPVYFLRDPELIRQVTVKEFDHFVNHRLTFDEELEPLFGRSLFAMKDQKWRDMRATLSPAFTGSKMRQMFPLMVNCATNARDYIKTELKKGPVELELKEFFTRFTNDVIATCAFGVQIDSQKDKDNEFYTMGKEISNFDGIIGLKIFGFITYPRLMKLLNLTIFRPEAVSFFRNLINSAMKYRQDNKIVRPDMIHLLMQAKQVCLKEINSSSSLELRKNAIMFLPNSTLFFFC